MNTAGRGWWRLVSSIGTLGGGALVLVVAGCTSLKADVPFRYAPSLRSGDPVEGKAVFHIIEDARSKDDRQTTREITDCADKLTSKLVEDFRTSRVFTDVDYSSGQTACDFVINGKLEEFSWKHRSTVWAFIPYAPYFGPPIAVFTGKAKITLEVTPGSTGSAAAQYSGVGMNETAYTLYELKGVEMGVELQYALRDVVKQLKDQITGDATLRGQSAVPK